MKTTLTQILVSTILLTSCEFSIDSNTSKKADLEPMPEVKAQTFKNIYISDEEICESKELPLTRFAVEYPDGFDVEMPKDKQNHLILSNKVGNIVVEELTIGNSTVTLKNRNLALELLEKVVNNFKDQFPDLEIVSIGKKEFNGSLTYLFEGKIDYSDFEAQGYTGVYKMIFLLPIPKNNEDLNAVFISLLANDQSEIQTFSDFQDSGMIGKVYKTFRYIE